MTAERKTKQPTDGSERVAPKITAVGGGKGGVGKSLVCSSLAIAAARAGHRTVLVDLDLGAANAHSLLGMRPPELTLSDFVQKRVEGLEEVRVSTRFEGLSIVAGSGAALDLANLKFSQKERLIRQIKHLDADQVFLDLSAGSTYNVLDFFLVAEHRLAVVIPEAPSIENTQHFLKAAFFRSLRGVAREEPMRSALELALAKRGRDLRSARDLIEIVRQLDADCGETLAAQALSFAPDLVVNQLSPHAPADVATRIVTACRHHLAAGARERARLPRDERVRESLAKGKHVVDAFPGAPFVNAVQALSASLLADEPVEPVATAPRAVEAQPRRASFPPFEGVRPGRYLRTCRELAGLDLEEMHRRTRIRCLDQLESERFELLPTEVYVSSFVRQYAEALGVSDTERIATRYLEDYATARRGARTARATRRG